MLHPFLLSLKLLLVLGYKCHHWICRRLPTSRTALYTGDSTEPGQEGQTLTNLDAARFQMAYSLAFHMIFAALGVGMPLHLFIAEGLWLRTRQEHYLRLAKTWAKATGILFAIGAVSGTGLAFEMGLLWPRFMGFAGSTIGPAFTLEGFAFFLEAIFLGLYLYGWERVSPLMHWLAGLVVALSGAASSILVVAANAWMQNPVGVETLITNPGDLNAAAALFGNPAWPLMAIHSTLATYAATGFAVAGVYAWGALQGRRDAARRSAVAIALAVGVAAALAMPITGDLSARDVARRQPVKLAAMEAHFRTERGASLLIGGWPDPAAATVRWAIRIPGALSFLAFGDVNAEVAGLDRVPRDLWPNITLTHVAFQVMVGAGAAMLVVGALYWWARWRRPGDILAHRTLMWVVTLAAPLGMIALQAGWIVTEIGRQPWIIYGVMTIAAAVTTAPGLKVVLAGFVTLYAALAVILVWLLNRLKHA